MSAFTDAVEAQARQMESLRRRLAREQARKRYYRDELLGVRDALADERVDILWSNGGFWIEHLSKVLRSSYTPTGSNQESKP